SAQVVAWVALQPAAELFTTAITEAEIFYGIEWLAKGKRRDSLLAAAEKMFTEDFAGRILGFESEAARHFAAIAARRRAHGRPISQVDGQIAAITRSHGARLATGNGPDFADCDIVVIDPWV
ncbi:MAG: PIN domain-containing protein, partial [Terriglobales bacterium]